MEVIYHGDHKYAALVVKKVAEDTKEEHKCYRSAPSRFWTLGDGTELHIISYHTPKTGIKIRCWASQPPPE